jgi:hypothetical protein
MVRAAWSSTTWSRIARKGIVGVIVAVMAPVGVSCSLLVDPGRVQCAVDQDCRARGGDFVRAVCRDSVCRTQCENDDDCRKDGGDLARGVCRSSVCLEPWSCLGSVTWPAPVESRKVTVTIRMRDLITGLATPGVTGRLCPRLDYPCDHPIGDEISADGEGNLSLPVELGFDGYVELRAPDKMPGLYFFYPPVDGDREVPFMPLFTPTVAGQFAQINGKSLRLDRGSVLLATYDCQHSPADGVSLRSKEGDADTAAFYIVGKLPKANATATDISGQAGLINLPPGPVEIVGSVASDGRIIGRDSVWVRAGAFTYTSLVPSPGN